jgi:uncharacterized membrane protein (UPF0136 family)
MSNIEFVCILCSFSWAIAIIAFCLLTVVGYVVGSQHRRTSTGVDLICGILILTTIGGLVGWAAEDAVCSAAGVDS